MLVSRRTWRARAGLTLIELVVVLVILAALAMLVLPRLDFMKSQADFAQAAAASADIMANIEEYKITTGYYPVRFDSLLTTAGDLYHNDGPPATGLWIHDGLSATLGAALDQDVLTAGEALSFAHSFGADTSGKCAVMDHTAASTDPPNSATTQRNLAFDGTDKVAVVLSSSLIKASGYPTGTLPTGTRLIVLGVGPSNSAVGRTMATAPRQSIAEVGEYARFIAVFAVYNNGKAAELKTVVDSRRTSIDSRINSFKKAGPTHE